MQVFGHRAVDVFWCLASEVMSLIPFHSSCTLSYFSFSLRTFFLNRYADCAFVQSCLLPLVNFSWFCTWVSKSFLYSTSEPSFHEIEIKLKHVSVLWSLPCVPPFMQNSINPFPVHSCIPDPTVFPSFLSPTEALKSPILITFVLPFSLLTNSSILSYNSSTSSSGALVVYIYTCIMVVPTGVPLIPIFINLQFTHLTSSTLLQVSLSRITAAPASLIFSTQK